MANNETLETRISDYFLKAKIKFETKKMMGGLTFMVDDKMCVGIVKDELMCRINPELHETTIKKKGCRTMDFTKKPMKGFVFVSNDVLKTEKHLSDWLELAIDFNKISKKSSKKKK